MKIPIKLLAKIWACAVGIMLLLGMASCSNDNDSKAQSQQVTALNNLDVYKSPTCGCCKDWVDHIEAAGFTTLVHHSSDLGSIKQQYGISSSYQSCHTAVSDQGYVFEGHIPAQLMQRFLDNPPEDVIGLAVPGMPMGSPGMEMGDRYDDYQVLLIYKDGRTEVFADVKGQETVSQ